MSMVSNVQDLLNDAGIFWPAAQVYDAMNEAEIEVWKELKYETSTGTITATTNQEFVTIPATIMVPMRIVAQNVEWFPVTKADLERDNRKWRGETPQRPKFFVVYDAETFQLTPLPDLTYTWTVEGVAYPTTEFSGTATDITAPSQVKRSIEFLAASLLAAQTRPDLTTAWLAEYIDSLKRAKVELRNRGGHNIRRLRPGKRVTVAHAGNRSIGRFIGSGN